MANYIPQPRFGTPHVTVIQQDLGMKRWAGGQPTPPGVDASQWVPTLEGVPAIVHRLTASFLETSSIHRMMETSQCLSGTWAPLITHLCLTNLYLPVDYDPSNEEEPTTVTVKLLKRVLSRRKSLTSITSTSGLCTTALWQALAVVVQPSKLKSLDVTISQNRQLDGARDVCDISLRSLTVRFAVTTHDYYGKTCKTCEDGPWIDNLYPLFESGMCNYLEELHVGTRSDHPARAGSAQEAITKWLHSTGAPHLKVLTLARKKGTRCLSPFIQALKVRAPKIHHLELGQVAPSALHDLAALCESHPLLVMEARIWDPPLEHLASLILGLAPTIQRMNLALDYDRNSGDWEVKEATTRAAFQAVMFPALVDLTLAGAWITDEAVASVPYLANLHRLHLKGTSIKNVRALVVTLREHGAGELPLRDFSLEPYHDRIGPNVGALITELGRATNLERLELKNVSVRGDVFANVSWPHLRHLGLGADIRTAENYLLHRLPGLATNLESLVVFNLSTSPGYFHTYLTNVLTSVTWPRLRSLDIKHSDGTGVLMQLLRCIPELRKLSLQYDIDSSSFEDLIRALALGPHICPHLNLLDVRYSSSMTGRDITEARTMLDIFRGEGGIAISWNGGEGRVALSWNATPRYHYHEIDGLSDRLSDHLSDELLDYLSTL